MKKIIFEMCTFQTMLELLPLPFSHKQFLLSIKDAGIGPIIWVHRRNIAV